MKKGMYILLILVIGLILIPPTFAIFRDEYTTDKDVVGLNLNFDLKMSNIEEYEELKIDANSYEIYNINISNATSDNIYYGIWYKIVNKDNNDNIKIGRLEDNLTPMSGMLEFNEEKTAGIIIKNNTSNDITVNIGVASSEKDAESIEYLGGKQLITGSFSEVDYDYDETNKKYVSSIDNNTYFLTNSINLDNTEEEITIDTNTNIIYQVELWGAANKDNDKGAYTKGTIKLSPNDKLYLNIGKKQTEENTTEIRVVSNKTNEELSKSSSIMIANTKVDNSYISGHLGYVADNLDEEMKKKCQNGLEDIKCSYHSSKIFFKNTEVIDNQNEMPTYDGKQKMIGNDGNGYAKITPVVPSIDIEKTKIKKGDNLDPTDITCKDNGNGCFVARIYPSDTTELPLGDIKFKIMVIDNDGLVYRYTKTLEIIE